MSRIPAILAILSNALMLAAVEAQPGVPATIVCPAKASAMERLAAKEVRRYAYLRTGTLLPMVAEVKAAAAGDLIVVGAKDRPEVQAFLVDPQLKTKVDGLSADQYVLKTLKHDGRDVLLVAGGDAQGVLYGAYRLAEHLGIRFYLHGDVVPDKQVAWKLPALDEMRKPLFDRRGIQPFHDFPEGPDWWSRDGYKAILGQLPKMGMNFLGLHAYPECGVGPEALVWIGPPDEIDANGRVKASYPSKHFTTANPTGAFGYQPGKTSDYYFGAADLFDRDDYGVEYMHGTDPWPQMSPERCNKVFDDVGQFLSDVFTFAHTLGIKTCIGTETPMIVPAKVRERLQAAGKDPKDPAVVQSLYEGMFERIAKIHPLDYYWLWTNEQWTWGGAKPEEVEAVMADFRAFLAAGEKVKPPFTLATCGWMLGPPQNPAQFDEFFPKNMPLSCINRYTGFLPVEPDFAKITGRPKWAIPWLEDDPCMTTPQLWAGRMRHDAFDALQYGCTGLMGIHWRTRILAPNVAALAQAAWDQQGWSKGAKTCPYKTPDKMTPEERDLPVADFYADWAATEFGPEAAEPIAALFTRLDGRLPRPVSFITGPGSFQPDPRPWEDVQSQYAFVDELAALRPKIVGAGNLERFDYWLNTFRSFRAIGHATCARTRVAEAFDKVKAEKDPEIQKKMVREIVVPAYKKVIDTFTELNRYLLAAVSTTGDLGNVCNWQQQSLPATITVPGQEIAKLLGEDLPADLTLSKQYQGEPRVIVPEIRTSIAAGESLKLTVIILGGKPEKADLCWRSLGSGAWSKTPLSHVARGVYTATLPAKDATGDFEYYIEVAAAGKSLVFPPTAPTLPQTVVVAE